MITRAIIIDDEIPLQTLMRGMIARYLPEVEMLCAIQSVHEAINQIQQLKPDLIFLDVEILGGTGFDVLRGIDSAEMEVIFVTGYSKYAIDALRVSAVDYVLKPIDHLDLMEAYQRYIQRVELRNKENPHVILKGVHMERKIYLHQISSIEILDGLCQVRLVSGQQFLSTTAMKTIQKFLDYRFIKSHRKHWVNLAEILEVGAGRGGPLRMRSGEDIPLAFRRKADVVKRWSEG